MEDSTTVSAAYIFRGIEYIVTMNVKAENGLTVEVEDKLTADQWRADFDAACMLIFIYIDIFLPQLPYADYGKCITERFFKQSSFTESAI